ncbi:DUF7504 family protein [Salinigranum rubrum]|nr:hypothetical protein [Salinigranum rubrum]
MGTTEDGHTREQPESLSEQIGSSSNALLCGPATSDVDTMVCRTLLTGPYDRESNVLHVEFTRSLDECGRVGEETVQPARMKIVKVGDMIRSVATQATSVGTQSSESLIETVHDPADLTALGVAVTRILDSWQETDQQTIVCFHSVTALLDHVDCYLAFRFLHVLTSRIETAGAVAHYHLDPTAHDDQTVTTIIQLFDTVAEFDDGDWTVRTR